MENNDWAKQRVGLGIGLKIWPTRHPVSTVMASGSAESSFDWYYLCCDDEVYLTPTNVAETTTGLCDCAACRLPATTLYLNFQLDAPENWVQMNPNFNDHHSDRMDISSTYWIADISNWWRQQNKTRSQYPDLSTVAWDIFSIMSHGVGVVVRFSLGPDVIGQRQ